MDLQQILALAAKKTSTRTGYATAKALGRKPNTIYQWESGLRAPDVDACVQLAAFTGLTLEVVINAAREARRKKRKATATVATIALSLVALALTSYAPESRAALSSTVDALCIMLNRWWKSFQAGKTLPATTEAAIPT